MYQRNDKWMQNVRWKPKGGDTIRRFGALMGIFGSCRIGICKRRCCTFDLADTLAVTCVEQYG
jgi:hypothetical protein